MTTTFLQSETTTIKICGLVTEEHVDVAVAAGAHAIGFVFVPGSPRTLDRGTANRLLTQLPPEVLPIAVLQDYGDLDDFSDWPGWLQLCGAEDEEMIARSPRPVIKALQWNAEELVTWDSSIDIKGILVDGSSGGLGKMAPIESLAKQMDHLLKPIIIAGGLTPLNVGGVIAALRPAAVDVSSGIESSKGVKDSTLICEFVEEAMRATSET